MKRKILVGLIAIVAVAIFVGCIEKDQVSTPTATPSPKITPKPTPTTTPSPTITPTPTEKSGPDLIVEDIKAIAIRKPSLPSELPSYITSVTFTVKNVRVIDSKGIGEIVGNLVVVNYGIYPGEKPIKGFPPTGVTPGLPRTGNVFFEVPKDSEKLKLKVGSHRWKCNYAIIDIETSKIIEENIEEWTKD